MQPAALTAHQALQQAISHHQAGQLREAEVLYRAILKAQPQHADAQYNLGVLAVQVKQPSAGLPHFAEALQARPEQAQYWLGYIDALLHAGQTAVARQTLEQGQQRGLQGKAVDALKMRLAEAEQLAEASIGQQQATEGLQSLAAPAQQNSKKKVKTISSQQTGKGPGPQEISALGLLFSGGRYEEAANQAQAMTVRYPQHGFGWKVLGAALAQTSRSNDALEAMQKASLLSPGDAEVHVNLGLVLSAIGQHDEAEASHRRALAIKPNYVDAHCKLGNVLKDMGRLKEAVANYQSALGVNPDLADVHNNLGATLKDMGLLDESEKCYRRALELKPDYVEGHYNLGNVLKDMGRTCEAVASYQRALGFKPDLAEAINNIGCWRRLNFDHLCRFKIDQGLLLV